MAIVAVCRLAILKRTAATPLTLLLSGTLGAGTSESASPERWKDEGLGWFPNPKGEYTEFSNGIIKMRKEKKKEETERERKERLKRDYNEGG